VLQNLNNFVIVAVISLIGLICATAAMAPDIRENTGSSSVATTIVVKDMMERNVLLREPAKRAMIFTPMAWHFLTVDETDAHIGWIAPYLKDEAKETLLAKLFPTFVERREAAVSFGTIPLGAEQILLDAPDVVLTWAWFSRELEAVHFPGIIELTGSSDLDEASLFKLLGNLTGKSSRVDALLQHYQHAVSDIYAHKFSEAKTRGVMVIGGKDLFFWNANFDDFNMLVKGAGGRNVAENIKGFGNSPANIEELIKLDPQVILLAFYTSNPVMPQDIYDNPALAGISAVKNHRVYRMPNGASRMSGPVETPLLLSWLARLLHPEIDWKESLRDEIAETFRAVYGYTISDDDIDVFLQVKENRISVGYDIFERKHLSQDIFSILPNSTNVLLQHEENSL